VSGESRAGYLNLPQQQIAAEPAVHTFPRPDGGSIAIVELGPFGLTVHIETVAGGRAIAAAFSRAADLIQAAAPQEDADG
jgi:hypothetical protein